MRTFERRNLSVRAKDVLVGVHYVWRTKLVERLIQCINAKRGIKCVRDTLGKNLSPVPIHDCYEI